jgi:hypothetical protein
MELISKLLLEEINQRFNHEPLDASDIEWSDNFAEMLEKYIILHIRTWKIEDACAISQDPKEIAELKKKLDYCFKDRRPKLTRAINSYLDHYINKYYAKSFNDGNVKEYKGFYNDNI